FKTSSQFLIMDKQILDQYIRAGKIASEVRKESKKMITVGAPLLDIAEKIEALIKKKGALLAFPVNISINDAAAHYTPTAQDKTIIKDNDIIKIDIGTHIDGYVGDTAYTISLNPEHESLVKASEQALEEAIKLCTPGTLLSDISEKIEETIKSFNLKPIANLTGHGLDQYDLHADPQVPNIGFSSSYKIEENQIIAIEPFATDGAGLVKESPESMIFRITTIKPTRNMDARKIIEWSEQFQGLPFAERWLNVLKFSEFKLKLALRELRNIEVLHEYPVLKEMKGGMISQAEHTIIIKEKPIVTTL
ncbi:MAG: type II methionyl aminopeptidase, partial [Candidatus Aenigmatarchaeota archaeon]